MKVMTVERARYLIRRYGWTAFLRIQTSGKYLWAVKRINGNRIAVYVSAETKLEQWNTDKMTALLHRNEAA